MSRFPSRTLVLMLMALIAFAFMYVQLHRRRAPTLKPGQTIQWIDLTDGGIP